MEYYKNEAELTVFRNKQCSESLDTAIYANNCKKTFARLYLASYLPEPMEVRFEVVLENDPLLKREYNILLKERGLVGKVFEGYPGVLRCIDDYLEGRLGSDKEKLFEQKMSEPGFLRGMVAKRRAKRVVDEEYSCKD